MALQDPVRNTYEEFADELKETLAATEAENGQTLSIKVPKEKLLHDHDWHLMLLARCALPPRNIVLPPPYPPSKVLLADAQKIALNDLRIGFRSTDELLVLRTVTDPYVYSFTVVITEDEAGDPARLTVCNLGDSMHDSIVSKGCIIAIKQPCWTKVPGGGYHIRVDHPTDMVLLASGDGNIPPKWRICCEQKSSQDFETCRKEVVEMLLKKRFRKALELYEHALAQHLESPEAATSFFSFYKQVCRINLALHRIDDAAQTLSHAIALYAQSQPSLASSDITNSREVSAWLLNHSVEDPLQIAPILPSGLRDVATRIRFSIGIHQSYPDYDLSRISSYVGPSTLCVDAANYTDDTVVKQTTTHGRGLFAKKAFKTGEMILAEKAFAFPQYAFNDTSCECSLYSLGDDTTTDRAGTLLFQELVRKLRYNVSLRKAFFDLDDGGYWEKAGWTIEDGDDVPVDIFRIEHIRRRNCFSAPLRSLNLLTTPTPVRNGFWIHSSYVNHACLPNSVRTFMGDMLFLRAARDIEAGEEITSQYVAPALTYGERQKNFEHTWGFACDCTLCAVDKKTGTALEFQRMTMFEELKNMTQKFGPIPTVTALKKMTKRLRDLEALYDGDTYSGLPRLCLVHPTLYLTEAWRALKNVDRMMGCASKLLLYFGIVTHVEDMKLVVSTNSGLVNVETVRALKYLAEGYEAKRCTELAGDIKEVAKVWFKVITGAEVGVEEFMGA